MDKATALRELLAKVEAGEASGKFGPIMRDYWAFDLQADAMRAYNGSLDAAKALHEAVLGDGYVSEGFNYVIYGSGKVSVWNVITGVSGRGEVTSRDLHNVCTSRAWLIAILKALIAQESSQ